MLRNPSGGTQVAFQQVVELPAATWPDGPRVYADPAGHPFCVFVVGSAAE